MTPNGSGLVELQVFRERLRKKMRSKNFSQGDLAARMRVERATVGSWLREDGGAPTLTQFLQLTTQLDTSARWLVGISDEEILPIYPTPEEREWLTLYRAMGPTGRAALRSVAAETVSTLKGAKRV